MLKNKLVIRLFSSGLQAIAVQILSSAFFYLTSIYLTKNDFGAIGWMNSVCIFITVVLGFGLEQVVVRRIAASQRSDWAAAAFLAHSVAGAVITFLILLVINEFVKGGSNAYHLLPWFFIVQALLYIGVPLKQYLNAKEKFTPYGIIAVVSNLAKIIAAFILVHKGMLTIHTVILILICSAAFELGGLFYYVTAKTTFSFKLHFKAYVKLLKESSAQYLSVIFDMSLSRMDWILLGMMSTNLVLADYSFAYRAYELAKLPVIIIAPIILPRLARYMSAGNKPDDVLRQHIHSFYTVEMFVAVLIPLALNILWAPLLTMLTHGKYGQTNALQFLILSLCIPLQFFINLFWSLSFSAKRYRSVSSITIVCAVTNIALNLILIPQFKGLGSAVAFFTTTLLQAVLYYRVTRKHIMPVSLKPVLVFTLLGLAVYIMAIHLPVNFLIQTAVAIILYLLIAVLLRQVNRQHFYNFKQFLSK